jgi:signal recognition particle receptor subunit beta
MASFNFSTRQMSAKIVYYGPGLCGKTTSLKYVFHHTRPDARGKMVSLATETDRTLFFDLLPLEVGTVAGFHTRIQLYTVPGQVFYNSTRRLVLKGVDGIVFVADSQPAMLPSNVESFRNLEVNLAELGIKIDEIPLVLQYNKRDLPEVCSVAELGEALNSNQWPEFETSALAGTGIFEVLREISKLTLISLKKQLEDGVPDVPRPRPPRTDAVAGSSAKLEPVAVASSAAPSLPPPIAGGPSDDEVEDSALAQLDTAAGSDVAVAAVPAPEPEAARPERAAPIAPVEAAAETEAPAPAPTPSGSEIAELAKKNGRRSIDRALSLALRGADLEQAKRLSLDLQVRDGRDRVLHQVRDIEWNLHEIDRLQDVLLLLKIELERDDS